MMVRIVSAAACLALAVPAALSAQTDEPESGAVDLDAIDALLGGAGVTGDADAAAAAAEGEEAAADDAPAPEEGEEADVAEEEAHQPSDLTIAFNAYSLCASEAGAALEETGFALDVIGQEALLHCSGQRAAYLNAFYFSLAPHYPDAGEAEIRNRAERLVAQSDTAIANVVLREVTDLREIRELDAAAEAEEAQSADPSADPSSDDDVADETETPDGESAEDEMDPDA